jgi:hypothetical protein
MLDNVTLDQVRSNPKHDFTELYHKTLNLDEINDSPFMNDNLCNYYDTDDFTQLISYTPISLSFYHLNCRGLACNWDNFNNHLLDMCSDSISFHIIGISEIFTQ